MQPLLLLHGAIGAASQLRPLAKKLEDQYDVHLMDFAGHGGKNFPEEPFSIALFAQDVIGYMDDKGLKQTDIFGYSMGGYVAMYLARHYPERVGKMITLATKYSWDEATAAREVQMLNADKIENKLPAFAQTLKERHDPQDWRMVLQRTADMMLAMGADNPLKMEDYAHINHRTLILLGDRDKMVGMDETLAVYKMLPNAAMGVLPNTPHPAEQVDVDLLAYFIRRFV